MKKLISTKHILDELDETGKPKVVYTYQEAGIEPDEAAFYQKVMAEVVAGPDLQAPE